MKRRITCLILAVLMLFSCNAVSLCATESKTAYVAKGYIDNSSLIPKILPDSQVKLESGNNGKIMSPDWVKTLIMEEMNVALASPNGRFSGMNYVLDHVAEMGVNGIWLTPIYDGKHYRNNGPATVDTYLTGTIDYEKGWQVVADFVKEAHKRNIRVFLDIVTWGANEVSDIYVEHPDWFEGYSENYGGPLYNWKNKELEDWFVNEMIDIVHKTDIDGFRADCGISYCGATLYERVRSTLHAEGNYIAIIGETINDQTAHIFDFDEHSVNYDIETEGTKYIDGSVDITTATKTGYGLDTTERQLQGQAGKNRFYTSIITCHDSKSYLGNGTYISMAYASVLSPFIPLWYIGEEWDCLYNSTGWLWANRIDWSTLDANRDYYETVKAYLRIRRLYPEIFEYFPENHRDSNICKVETDHPNATLEGYARYTKDKGILVVPNLDELSTEFEIKIPYKDMGLDTNGTYQVVNLLSGKTVALNKASELEGFITNISTGNVATYLVERVSDSLAPVKQQGSDTTKPVTVPTVNQNDTKPSEENTAETEKQEESDKKDETPSKKPAKKPTSGNEEASEESSALIWWILGGALVAAAAVTTAVLLLRKKK